MRIINFTKNSNKNVVLALGNFDGVHIGHKKILESAIGYARKHGMRCYAMTFDPHPQQIVDPGKRFKLLTTLRERGKLMRDLGVDGIVIKKFDQATRKMPASKFISSFLFDGLKVSMVFVGYDFAFGRNREGDVGLLKKLGKKYGFEVHAVPPVKHGDVVVKSSGIRRLMIYGKFNEAVKLLGHSYFIHGKVVSGTGTGKKLGFPTANLSIDPEKLTPGYGVYFGRVLVSGKIYKCLVNVGSRPTFSGDFAIETHIIGYRGHLAGKKLNVELFRKIREEKEFASAQALKKQIARDVRLAKRIELRSEAPQ